MPSGIHAVTVYPDRAAGSWSPPIASNPYFSTDLTGWQPMPFAKSWNWVGGAAQVAGKSELSRAAASPVPRVTGVDSYRVRAVVTIDAPNVFSFGLFLGRTPDAAWSGPFWSPADAQEVSTLTATLPPGTHTLEATLDVSAIASDYTYLGPHVRLSNDVGSVNRVESIELSYQGAAGVDISCLVEQVSIVHGREEPGGQPDASSATIDIQVRPWDPLPADVEIGAVLVVTTTTPNVVSQRFSGRVTDIVLGWDDRGEDTPDAGQGQIIATGILADLGRRVVGDTPWPMELDGARVARVMAAAGVELDPAWSDPGTVNVLARDVDSQPALDVAQETAQSGTGVLWETRAGEVRYADADHRRRVGIALTLDSCDLLVTPSWRRTLEGLVNSVSLGYGTTPSGGEQPRYLEDNANSIARYGTYDYTSATALAQLVDAQNMARLLLARNSSPVWVMANLPVAVGKLDDERYEQLLGLDMHSLIGLTGLPAIGAAPTSASLFVEGWSETLAFGTHDIELTVSGYCRTTPALAWDEVNPAWLWGDLWQIVTRRNTFLNPNLATNSNYWTYVPQASGTGVATRETTDGPPGLPTAQTYLRFTWQTISTGAIASTGFVVGSPSADHMAITPGVLWTFSAYWRSNVPDRTAALVITYHDAAGATLATHSVGAERTTSNGQWVRAIYTPPAVPPPTAVRAYVRLYSQSGRTWQVGDTMEATAFLAEASPSAQPYFDGDTQDVPRAREYAWTGTPHASASTQTDMGPGVLAEVRRQYVLNPSFRYTAGTVEVRRNLVTNPSFETDVTGWTGVRCTISKVALAAPNAGANCMRCNVTDTSSPAYAITGPSGTAAMPYPAATSIQFGYSVRGQTTSRSMRAQLYEYDSAGVLLTPVLESPSVNVTPGVWTRVEATMTTKATTAYVRLVVGFAQGEAVGAIWDVDACYAGAPGTYFDGATAVDTTLNLTASWTGTAHASAAILTGPSCYAGKWAIANAVAWQAADGQSANVLLKGGAAGSQILYPAAVIASTPSQQWSIAAEVTDITPDPTTLDSQARIEGDSYNGAGANTGVFPGPYVTLARAATRLTFSWNSHPADTTGMRPIIRWSAPAGRYFNVRSIYAEKLATPATYFDGDSPDSVAADYQWTGQAQLSESVAKQPVSQADSMPTDLTWDDMHCLGPPVTTGRWADIPTTTRWDQVDPALTWDTSGSVFYG